MSYQLRLVDQDNTAGVDVRIVARDANYIYTGDATRVLRAWSFDGTTLTHITNTVANRALDDVLYDGTYIHSVDTAAAPTYINMHSFDGAVLTLEDSDNNNNRPPYSLAYDGSFLYTGTAAYLTALSIVAGAYNWLHEINIVGKNFNSLAHDGTYLYALATDGTLYALTYTQAGGFVNVANVATGLAGGVSPNIGKIVLQNNYIHVCMTDVETYTFNGVAFNNEASLNPAQDVNGACYDGSYLFLSCDNGLIYVYDFDETALTFSAVTSITLAGNPVIYDVINDSNYLYAGSNDNKLSALQMSLFVGIYANPRTGVAPLNVNLRAV